MADVSDRFRAIKWPLAALSGAALVLIMVLIRGQRDDEPDVRSLVRQELTAAKSAIRKTDIATARQHLDRLLELDPQHAQALLYRGQARRDAGDLEGAIADWRAVPVAFPDQAGLAAYLESTILLDRGDAVTAEERLLDCIRLTPGNEQSHECLVELYVVQMRRDDLRAHLERIRTRRMLSIQELAFLAVPVDRATTPDAGVKLLRKYVATRPDDLHSQLALASYLMLAQHPADSEEILADVRKRQPHDEIPAALLALALLKQENPDEAEELLARFPVAETSSAALLRSHAQLSLARQDWESAANYLSRAVDCEPEDLTSRYQLGLALRQLGRVDAAKQCLQTAELINTLQMEALRLVWQSRERIEQLVEIGIRVAEPLVELGQFDRAIEWYRQVLAVAPHSIVARDGLLEAMRRQAEQQSADDAHSVAALMTDIDGRRASARDSERDVSPGSREGDFAAVHFRDVHSEVGLKFQYFNGGSEFKYLVESTGGGVAVLDIERDGWPDLYFTQGRRLPLDIATDEHLDQLWRNRQGHSFVDVSVVAGVHEPLFGQGISAGDLDGDGFADLFVANYGRNTFFHNNGDGTFTDVTDSIGLRGEVMSSSAAFADLNRDGLLDVYSANYLDSTEACLDADGSYSTCSPSNFEGEQDRLYLNDGEGGLVDITEAAGITAEGGKGLGIIVSDLNQDAWPDIYVANDTTPNFYFRNLRTTGEQRGGEPRFEEIGLLAGLALSGEGRAQAGMGVASADFDGNGWQDLYVTNFFQETNTLYRNDGDDLFSDATQSAGLARPTHGLLGFGTQAADFNLDGWPDLFVANGHIDDFRDRNEPWKMPPQLFVNRGAGDFVDASESAGLYFQGEYLGRGVARVDWNRDGKIDLVVVHQDRPAALLRNETEVIPPAVVVELIGTQSNRDAINAQIKWTVNGVTRVHEIVGGDGFFASNERRQILGVGDFPQIDQLEVIWPSGRHDEFRDIPTASRLVLVEGREHPSITPLVRVPSSEAP